MIEPFYLAILVGLLVILLTTFFFLRQVFGPKADTVLLIGLSDSGKTQIFSKLVNRKNNAITYTSLSENVFDGLESPSSPDSPLRLVDFPGAERLRETLVEKWLKKERSTLKSIVAVIDSSSINKRARDVAELLYDALLESASRVPLVVACNKQDISLAKEPHVVSALLEKEFSLINQSRAASLTSTDGSNHKAATLSPPEKPFQWSQLPLKVEFVKCSALDEDGGKGFGLDGIRQLIGV